MCVCRDTRSIGGERNHLSMTYVMHYSFIRETYEKHAVFLCATSPLDMRDTTKNPLSAYIEMSHISHMSQI